MNTKFVDRIGPRKRRAAGFTLIELMITVLIVAILTAIAYPSYRNYVIRGQLVDATQGLSTLRANMERYFQDNRTYSFIAGFSHPCLPGPVTSGKFTITCAVPANGLTYLGTAVGSAGQLTGFSFTVAQDGTQATTITSPAPSAWIIACPATWVTRPGSCT